MNTKFALIAISCVAILSATTTPAQSFPIVAREHSSVQDASSHPQLEKKIDEARRLISSGKFDAATSLLKEALVENPKDAIAWNLLGNCYFQLDKFEESINAYSKALEIDPKSAVINENMAHVHYWAGHDAESMKFLDQALALDKSRDFSWFLKGLLLRESDKLSDAIQAFQTAETLSPNDIDYKYELGLALVMADRPDEAATKFKQVIALDAKFSLAHNMLGLIAWSKEALAEAEGHFRAAINADEKVGAFHANLAGALLRQGKKDEATAAAKKAKELGLKEHWSFVELGLK